MRAELVESKTKREALEKELHNLLLQLHSSQLAQLPNHTGNYKQDPNFKPDVNNIKKKLDEELMNSPSHIVKSKYFVSFLKHIKSNKLNLTVPYLR